MGHPNGAAQIPPLRFYGEPGQVAPVPRHAGAGGMTNRRGLLIGEDRCQGTERLLDVNPKSQKRDPRHAGAPFGFYRRRISRRLLLQDGFGQVAWMIYVDAVLNG